MFSVIFVQQTQLSFKITVLVVCHKLYLITLAVYQSQVFNYTELKQSLPGGRQEKNNLLHRIRGFWF